MTGFLLAAAFALGAPVVRAAPLAQPPGKVSATLEACHPGADSAERYATFAAQMSSVPGGERMAIRLELDERTPAAPDFRVVNGVPGFGVWKSSAPGVDIFGYSQEVTGLSAPAAFRVTVAYRWIGPRHRVLKRARRMTPTCSVAPAPGALLVGSLSRL